MKLSSKNLRLMAILFALVNWSHSNAQINYSENIATILFENCTQCHHDGGIAPFSLMTYNDAVLYGSAIVYSTENKEMPPWPMEPIDVGYVHDRSLSDQEIQQLKDWVNAGTPEGDPNDAPPAPQYADDYVLGNPDMQLKAPLYTSKATTEDEYVCFTVANTSTEDRWIEAIEVIPGNKELVHHCLVYIDEDKSYSADTTSGACGGPNDEILLGEYVPGSKPIVYPNNGITKMGVKLKAGSQLVLAMHYPEGSVGTLDSTKVNLHFYPTGTTGIREVYANPIISKWNFCLPANQETTVKAKFPILGGLQQQVSVLSVFPHMHLLGKKIKAFAVTPANDTIDLGATEHWDFEWQGFYVYKKMKILPAGSVIYGEAVYDNTSANDHNPNNPPAEVCAGANTSDEMFLIYFQYLLYQEEDENIDINGILDPNDNSTGIIPLINDGQFSIRPNIIQKGGRININGPLENINCIVSSIDGRVVLKKKLKGFSDEITFPFNLKPGTYILDLQGDKRSFSEIITVK